MYDWGHSIAWQVLPGIFPAVPLTVDLYSQWRGHFNQMEKAQVIEIHGNKAVIEAEGGGACASCSARHACLSLGGTSRRITVENSLGVKPGDLVEFVIDEKGMVLSSLIVYGIPIIGMMEGITAGTVLITPLGLDGDASGAFGGLAGIIVSLLIIKFISVFIGGKSVFTPRLTGVSPSGLSRKSLNNDTDSTENQEVDRK